MSPTLPLEQFLPPCPLAVTSVPNFDPTGRLLRQVQPGFPSGDDLFEVVLARQPEQPLTVAIDVVAVQEAVATPGHDRPEPQFAVDQR